eukprot:SAG22_NODE_125_length_18883_cov_12.351629_22_plen_73_part_00
MGSRAGNGATLPVGTGPSNSPYSWSSWLGWAARANLRSQFWIWVGMRRYGNWELTTQLVCITGTSCLKYYFS